MPKQGRSNDWRAPLNDRVISIAGILFGLTMMVLYVLRTSDIHFRGYADHEWIELLGSPDAQIRLRAVDALGAILRLQPANPPAVKALVRALTDSNELVQEGAVAALDASAVRETDALPSVILVMRDSLHPRARVEAATVLGTLVASEQSTVIRSSLAREAIAALTLTLGDRDAVVRARAIRELARARGDASHALPEIVRLAADTSRDVRLETAHALGLITPPTTEGRAALTLLSRDSVDEVRAAALQSIARIAPLSGRNGCSSSSPSLTVCSNPR